MTTIATNRWLKGCQIARISILNPSTERTKVYEYKYFYEVYINTSFLILNYDFICFFVFFNFSEIHFLVFLLFALFSLHDICMYVSVCI